MVNGSRAKSGRGYRRHAGVGCRWWNWDKVIVRFSETAMLPTDPDGSIAWYQLGKDFQTLIAALVALAAAIIAYKSAQQVAKRQIAATKEAEFKRQIALTSALMEWANSLQLIVSNRQLYCQILIDSAGKNGPRLIKQNDFSLWLPRVLDVKLLAEELPLSTISWQELSILSVDAQSIYHRFILCIQATDHRLIDIRTSFALQNYVLPSAPEELQEDYKRLSDEALRAYEGFGDVLKSLSPRYREMIKQE